jgi:hypothetical protein
MMEKSQPFQQVLLRKLDIHTQKLDPCPSPYTNISPKWIKDLSLRPETLKQLQEIVGNTQEHIGKDFLNKTPQAETKRKNEQMGLHQTKKLCTAKETVTRLKGQPKELEKIFASYSFDERLRSRIYKELQKLNHPKINIPMKKWAHELNREFSKEELQMAN